MRPLHIRQLAVRNLRVVRQVDVDLSPSVNVIFGGNGQGKTSLLEAAYLVATSRSFRTHRLKEVVTHGEPACSVQAVVIEGSESRDQSVAVSPTERILKVNGNKSAASASFAVRTPIVVFHPGDVALSGGPAVLRRTLLDRLALFLDPQSYEHATSYRHALRARAKLLVTQGPTCSALEPYEDLLVLHGCKLFEHRRRAAALLIDSMHTVLTRIGPENLRLAMRYVPGGTEDPIEMKRQLLKQRTFASASACRMSGPHRDDLLVEMSGRTTRLVASQGQHRLLSLSMKIAETVCIAKATGLCPILLLDDVSSELDTDRTQALVKFLTEETYQVLVSTTNQEVLSQLQNSRPGSRTFEMANGRVLQHG